MLRAKEMDETVEKTQGLKDSEGKIVTKDYAYRAALYMGTFLRRIMPSGL